MDENGDVTCHSLIKISENTEHHHEDSIKSRESSPSNHISQLQLPTSNSCDISLMKFEEDSQGNLSDLDKNSEETTSAQQQNDCCEKDNVLDNVNVLKDQCDEQHCSTPINVGYTESTNYLFQTLSNVQPHQTSDPHDMSVDSTFISPQRKAIFSDSKIVNQLILSEAIDQHILIVSSDINACTSQTPFLHSQQQRTINHTTSLLNLNHTSSQSRFSAIRSSLLFGPEQTQIDEQTHSTKSAASKSQFSIPCCQKIKESSSLLNRTSSIEQKVETKQRTLLQKAMQAKSQNCPVHLVCFASPQEVEEEKVGLKGIDFQELLCNCELNDHTATQPYQRSLHLIKTNYHPFKQNGLPNRQESLLSAFKESREEQNYNRSRLFKTSSLSLSSSSEQPLSNYGKSPDQLNKCLTGFKHQFQQVNKIILADQIHLESSFSDDSPSDCRSNKNTISTVYPTPRVFSQFQTKLQSLTSEDNVNLIIEQHSDGPLSSPQNVIQCPNTSSEGCGQEDCRNNQEMLCCEDSQSVHHSTELVNLVDVDSLKNNYVDEPEIQVISCCFNSNVSLKQRRNQRFKAFSHNNTPSNSPKRYPLKENTTALNHPSRVLQKTSLFQEVLKKPYCSPSQGEAIDNDDNDDEDVFFESVLLEYKREDEGCDVEQEKMSYDQREIGIGKYFCEKLFNVYGDNKLFQKKKQKLKKWSKMMRHAQGVLKRQQSEQFSQLLISPSAIPNENRISHQSSLVIQQLDEEQQGKHESPDSVFFDNKLSSQQRTSECHSEIPDSNSVLKKDLSDSHLSTAEESEVMHFLKSIKKNDFLKCLKKGPPMWYRWSAWKAAVDLNVEEHMYNYDFHKMNSANENTCLIDKQINKDVHRTFPQEPFFSEAQYENKSIESLRRVLKALSRYFEKVGYCQGMNFIAAYLLLISGGDEMQTFGMIVQMDKKYSIMSLFEEGFPLIQFMNFIFQREFGRRFSKLCRHFDQLKIPETMWVVQWIQTLFVNSLPLNVVCRFWDYIFYSNTILSVISICLSLINEFNSHLIKMSLEEISSFMFKLKQCSVVKGEMLNSPSKKQVLLSPLIDLLQKDSILTEHTVVIDPERILKRAANYHIQQKDIHSYVSEFKKINSIQKENTFLCQIQQQPYQQTQPTFINSIFSASNTPKKQHFIQNVLSDHHDTH